MKSLGTIKRGDTFSFTVAITDSSTGSALSGIASNLSCQGRYDLCDPTALVDMTISETTTSGTYLFAAASTATWRPGRKVCFDIEYNDGSNISSSETFSVQIEGDVTHE